MVLYPSCSTCFLFFFLRFGILSNKGYWLPPRSFRLLIVTVSKSRTPVASSRVLLLRLMDFPFRDKVTGIYDASPASTRMAYMNEPNVACPKDALHWRHSWSRFPSCTVEMWRWRLRAIPKALSHRGHLWARLCSWKVEMWYLRLESCPKAELHWGHLWSRFPSCTTEMWVLRLLAIPKAFSQ